MLMLHLVMANVIVDSNCDTANDIEVVVLDAQKKHPEMISKSN